MEIAECKLNIDLKRFQQVTRTPVALFGTLKKIDDFISFPEYLDMKPFIAPRKEDYGLKPAKIHNLKGAYDEQVLYRLYAVVVHIGNMVSTCPVSTDNHLTISLARRSLCDIYSSPSIVILYAEW